MSGSHSSECSMLRFVPLLCISVCTVGLRSPISALQLGCPASLFSADLMRAVVSQLVLVKCTVAALSAIKLYGHLIHFCVLQSGVPTDTRHGLHRPLNAGLQGHSQAQPGRPAC